MEKQAPNSDATPGLLLLQLSNNGLRLLLPVVRSGSTNIERLILPPEETE